jgi:AraC-like DNA-binding protein
VKAGDIVAINPGDVHTGAPADKKGWSYRMFYPSRELMAGIARTMDGSGAWMFPHSVISDRELATELAFAHRELEETVDTERSARRIASVFAELLRRHAIRRDACESPPERDVVVLIREYLEQHFDKNVRLETLGEIAGLSGFHLIRVFRKSMGLPPHAYLDHVRIVQAKSLLRAGCHISEVAFKTGYSDQSHLTRHFKRVVGVTPGHYQRSAVLQVVVGRAQV